jgi:hypothetical protein
VRTIENAQYEKEGLAEVAMKGIMIQVIVFGSTGDSDECSGKVSRNYCKIHKCSVIDIQDNGVGSIDDRSDDCSGNSGRDLS